MKQLQTSFELCEVIFVLGDGVEEEGKIGVVRYTINFAQLDENGEWTHFY